MLFARRKTAPRRLSREEGFTLIELLVVLIIIGLLGAMAIAAFANQQNKAHDAEAKVAARSAQTAMETYYIEHKSYSGATVAELEDVQTSLKDAPNLAVTQATQTQYEVQATSVSTQPVTFKVARAPNGTITRSCAPANTGGCKSGSW
jgi:prepilin-type N-terminal cleavage/methylation domain-containing protein